MFLDSGHFKHACGLLYIPLTATGDVFVAFLRKESHVSSNLQVAQSREPTSPLDCNATVSVAAASGCDLWTAIDENMAQLVQVIYWWFVSTFQERASAIKNDKLRSLMLANITHELRNPLNAIINFLELMLDDKAGDQGRDQAKQYARHAHEASRALLDIVNDLLFLTQMEAGQMVLREETFVLSEFVRSSVELFDVMAQRRGLELALDIDATLDGMVVVGDAGKIRQVISNLCGNAIKFTPAGRVRVSCKALDASADSVDIQLCVQDTGIGIPSDKLDRLFRDFERLESVGPLRRQIEGTGLGLAIVARLVGYLNGRVSVASQESVGSTFWTQEFDREAASQPSHASQAPEPGVRKNDSETNRMVLQRRLQLDGHHVSASQHDSGSLDQQRAKLPNGDPGQGDVAHAGQVDLVLMDLQMPVMSGVEAARQIRQFEAEHRMPRTAIVGVTGSGLDTVENACRQAGMDGVMTKPLDFQQVRDVAADVQCQGWSAQGIEQGQGQAGTQTGWAGWFGRQSAVPAAASADTQ
ncbi:histidine kinase-like ATPase [Entophlyctis helioformis]|nr:histidine kinase-like ATPase [Entophlyctis helioformis]